MSEKMLVDPKAVKRMVEDEGMTLGTALIFAAVPVPDEITTLRQQLADVTGCACNSEGPCKYHAMTSVSGRSYVLRKQAEKLEEVARLVKEGNEAGLSTVACIYEGLLLNATSLRNEAERAGGE